MGPVKLLDTWTQIPGLYPLIVTGGDESRVDLAWMSEGT